MQDYIVELRSEYSTSFLAQKAMDSVNLDKTIDEKIKHRLVIDSKIPDEYTLGLVVGSSGSGKTTLIRKILGDDCFDIEMDMSKAVIDQFDSSLSYDEVSHALTSVGLTSIPCWIKPMHTLSTGQRARAEAALKLSAKGVVAIDEWTSTVNREVGKIMSVNFKKAMTRSKKQAVLASCHYDIIDWLDPDWVIDCNDSSFIDRRLLRRPREEKIDFHIREVSKRTWANFSKYHYLSENLYSQSKNYGMFLNGKQIGFCNFANYSFVNKKMYHSNRVVIHPDYIGLGLGIRMTTAVSKHLHSEGYDIRAKFTSRAMLKSRLKHPNWKCIKVDKVLSKKQNSMVVPNKKITAESALSRQKSKSFYVTYYTFRYVDV